jgi:DNA-binding NarL/FixJ family response regulator
MIHVLLADDQALIRAGFAALVAADPDMDVVGQAATGREAVELARRTRPDVVLMDIRMPDGDGLWATRQIVGTPGLERCAKGEVDEVEYRSRLEVLRANRPARR